jgi:hypothetical protein
LLRGLLNGDNGLIKVLDLLSIGLIKILLDFFRLRSRRFSKGTQRKSIIAEESVEFLWCCKKKYIFVLLFKQFIVLCPFKKS